MDEEEFTQYDPEVMTGLGGAEDSFMDDTSPHDRLTAQELDEHLKSQLSHQLSHAVEDGRSHHDDHADLLDEPNDGGADDRFMIDTSFLANTSGPLPSAENATSSAKENDSGAKATHGRQQRVFKNKNASTLPAQKPRRAKTAYAFFVLYNRDKYAMRHAQSGDDGTSLVQVLKQAWKDADKDDKRKYKSMAARDKSRYASEVEHYENVLRQQQGLAGAPTSGDVSEIPQGGSQPWPTDSANGGDAADGCRAENGKGPSRSGAPATTKSAADDRESLMFAPAFTQRSRLPYAKRTRIEAEPFLMINRLLDILPPIPEPNQAGPSAAGGRPGSSAVVEERRRIRRAAELISERKLVNLVEVVAILRPEPGPEEQVLGGGGEPGLRVDGLEGGQPSVPMGPPTEKPTGGERKQVNKDVKLVERMLSLNNGEDTCVVVFRHEKSDKVMSRLAGLPEGVMEMVAQYLLQGAEATMNSFIPRKEHFDKAMEFLHSEAERKAMLGYHALLFSPVQLSESYGITERLIRSYRKKFLEAKSVNEFKRRPGQGRPMKPDSECSEKTLKKKKRSIYHTSRPSAALNHGVAMAKRDQGTGAPIVPGIDIHGVTSAHNQILQQMNPAGQAPAPNNHTLPFQLSLLNTQSNQWY